MASTNARPISAFTLVEIMIVVAIIGLLSAIATPNLIKARQHAQKNVCIRNLSSIDTAKEEWAMEKRKKEGDAVVETEVNAYLKGGARPACPAAGTYSYREVGKNPRCSLRDALGHSLRRGDLDDPD